MRCLNHCDAHFAMKLKSHHFDEIPIIGYFSVFVKRDVLKHKTSEES